MVYLIKKIVKQPKKILIKKLFRLFKKKILYRMKGSLMERYSIFYLKDENFIKKFGKKDRHLLIQRFLDSHKNLFYIGKSFDIKNFNKIEILKEAKKILRHEFNLLGSGKKSLGRKINWGKDFKSQYVWPIEHYTKLKIENFKNNSDPKIPWEISRFHHFTTLGKAYLLTHDETYAKEFKNQFEDWCKKNPYEFGINWACTMEVAIRVINLIFAFYFFRDSKILDYNFWLKYLKTIYLHGMYIFKNLEWDTVNTNHYLSDVVGLFYVGHFFKNMKDGRKWYIFSLNELEKEIKNQVYEDGVDIEASINYHRLVVELFLICYLLNPKEFSLYYKKKLEKMIEFIMYYTKPNGEAPIIGDMDNGRVINFWNTNINDHRDIVALGAILFKRNDFKKYGRFTNDLLWLVGDKGKKAFNAIKPTKKCLNSKAFSESGFYVMRDRKIYLIIHCGDIGKKGYGGHGHNDQLSFELNYNGEDIFVDPGSYVYSADVKLRHLFRSTFYHNVLQIDNKEMNKIYILRPYNMENQTKAKCIKWITTPKFDIFVGRHHGYAPTIHERKITFFKSKKEIFIEDTLKNYKKMNNVRLIFHLDPGIKPKIVGREVICGKIKLEVKEVDEIKVIDGYVSKSYGIKEKSKIIVFEFRNREQKKFLTKISIC